MNKLEEWWVKFDGNNTKLQEFAESEEQYFVENTFDTVREIYITHRTKLQVDQKALQEKLSKKSDEQSKTASTSFAAVNLDELKRMQEEQTSSDDDSEENDGHENSSDNEEMRLTNSTMNNDDPAEVKVLKFQYKELKRALTMAGDLNQNISSGMASAQIENIKLLWAEFRTSYRTVTVGEHQERCTTINFRLLQEKYLYVYGKLNDMANVKVRNKMVQLPQLKIPEFSGEVRDWRSFKDIFDKIVHNNATISNDIKIQYLKTYIKGTAARLVSHIAPNENNYETCYKILCKRYENKRENLGNFIDEIINLPKLKSETSDGLKKIHDTAYECIMSINNIDVSTKNWDALLIHILLKKLDSKTIVDYEGKLNNVKEPQKLNEFLEYLEQRFLALASAESKNNVKS